ncbi:MULTISPECIES: DUF6380 family protein [Streptomyces]|uniref:DUF6380 family protein n=1 Tax=Streptomyces heliomycini TaxID=284032 RepID=A0ABV5LI18_9ACTN
MDIPHSGAKRRATLRRAAASQTETAAPTPFERSAGRAGEGA